MALTAQKLDSFRKRLLAERELLEKDLKAATAQLINDDEVFVDPIDQASHESDKAVMLTVKNRERDLVWQIDTALKRIEAGTFGECESCGDAISDARMKASPSTTLCIDCKSEAEEEARRAALRA